jgi:asparaginyl-tRNA synthetase
MEIVKLKELKPEGQEIEVNGWIRTFRNNQFIALNDGSTLSSFQVVADQDIISQDTLKKLNTGAAIRVVGKLIESKGKGQNSEIHATEIEVLGESNPEFYPLQPKKHSFEFLRTHAHLRARTNTFGAIFRIRHHLSFGIHKYFNDRGFFYFHSPIITSSDAEGAGEMFKVSALDFNELPRTEEGEVDFSQDFFEKPSNLTVSGQLEAELGALALSKVYTFGPTFRAENSNTTRHLAEFWMIEPEIAFADLRDDMDLAEDMLKYLVNYILENCNEDLQFLNDRLEKEESQLPKDKRSPMPLIQKLQFVLENDFERVSYTEAVDILMRSKPNKKKKFDFIIESWGADLQSEHERYLVEKHFKKPVILYDYPKNIKAFYMRMNEDGKTVAAMDILFPGIGEIVGGSQREERLEVLEKRMEEMDIPKDEMSWYLDTRRFGTCPHAGFGLGFERLVQFVTGMGNIRDVIPFPRTPGNVKF